MWGYWFKQNVKLDAACVSPKPHSGSANSPCDIEHNGWIFFKDIKIIFRNESIWTLWATKNAMEALTFTWNQGNVTTFKR